MGLVLAGGEDVPRVLYATVEKTLTMCPLQNGALLPQGATADGRSLPFFVCFVWLKNDISIDRYTHTGGRGQRGGDCDRLAIKLILSPARVLPHIHTHTHTRLCLELSSTRAPGRSPRLTLFQVFVLLRLALYSVYAGFVCNGWRRGRVVPVHTIIVVSVLVYN